MRLIDSKLAALRPTIRMDQADAPPAEPEPAVKAAPISGDLGGKSFVFTGKITTFDFTRQDMHRITRQHNGVPMDRVTIGLDYLVIGARVGATKMSAAKKCGTKVISQNDFFRMIGML